MAVSLRKKVNMVKRTRVPGRLAGTRTLVRPLF